MLVDKIKYALKINWIKSIEINFRHFGFRGVLKMPILIQYGSRIKAGKGSITFEDPLNFAMLKLNYRNNIFIENGGLLSLRGRSACFNYMNVVNVFKGAKLEIGNNFLANGQAEISCRKRIKFGDDCLISVHTMFLDTDFHPIIKENRIINEDKEIIFGDRVWIGCNTTVLKGTTVGNDIVVGAGSLLSGKYLENNSIYANRAPLDIVKTGIVWGR
jgi:acetyltransferase-like isoleucine patch superfamily enzyme